jgi:drug/metabolite transporter (DMT)-like permease
LSFIRRYLPDLLSIYLVLVLGFHFIVLKDAVDNFAPITFNALRFMIGAVIMGVLVVRLRGTGRLHMDKRDLLLLFPATLFGLAGFQVLIVLALELTTSTNVSLVVATMPLWAAVISVVIGQILPRPGLFVGLVTVLFGVALVVLSSSEGTFRLQGPDVVGSGLALLGSFLLGSFTVLTSGIVERYGGVTNAIYRHLFTTFGLVVVAMPDLVTLTPDDLPLELAPNFLYSGLLASLSGFFISNYAIEKIGPTRFTNYTNFQPAVTAVAGILLLGEPLTWPLVIGGTLTIGGVMTVRHFTTDRLPAATPPATADPVRPQPAPARC